MRGEDLILSKTLTRLSGSPPHARGRPCVVCHSDIKIRITPACAGKTRSSAQYSESRQDHPRMRGEDAGATFTKVTLKGSPPHARGRPDEEKFGYTTVRITPACAGKTTARPRLPHLSADHPRMRGEDVQTQKHAEKCLGSPPHARGRPATAAAEWFEERITPACAGKTVRFPRESGKVVFQLTSFLLLST